MRLRPRREPLLAAAAAVLLALSLLRLRPALQAAPALLSESHAALGHALLTGAHPASLDPSFRLPLGPLLELSVERSGAAPAPALLAAALAAALLAAAAGALLGGRDAGLMAGALALFLVSGLPAPPGLLKMRLFMPFAALPALALALRARRPGASSDWLAGLAFAPSLLYRSTLFFLPLLLAAWELGRGRDRRSARSAARLLLPCAAAVLPWMVMTARLHGRPTPLERGASDMLVVGGALGMVDTTPEGDRRRLAPDAPEGPGALGWAARRVAAAPAPYAAAVVKRLLFALGLMPWLFLLAAGGLWRARRDPAACALAAFCGYFLLAHALLATLAYYYEPLWPVLAALAAGTLAGGTPRREDEGPARALLLLLLAPALAAAAAAGAVSLRYASLASSARPSSREALERALRTRPGDARLMLRDAELSLAQGRAAEALSRAGKAFDAWPDGPAAFTLAAAREASGVRGACASMARALSSGPSSDPDGRRLGLWFCAAVHAARRGERAAAGEAVRQAAAQWSAAQRLSAARNPQEREWERLLREGSGLSLGRRAAEHYADAPPQAWVPAFADAALAGVPLAAREPLLLLQRSAPEAACPRLASLAKAAPSARAWTDHGVCLYLSGRPADSLPSFRRAVALDPSFPGAADSLAVAERDTKIPSPSSKK